MLDNFKTMIETIKEVLGRNPRLKSALAFGGLATVVVVAALCGAMNLASAKRAASSGVGARQEQQQQGDSASDPIGGLVAGAGAAQGGSTTGSGTGAKKVDPNSADADLATSPAESSSALDVLSGYNWADSAASASYAFEKDGSFRSSGGDGGAYEVSDVKKSDPQESDSQADGGEMTKVTKTVYTFILKIADLGARSAVLTVYDYGGAQPTSLVLSCSAFAHTLVGAPKDQAVTIADIQSTGKLADACGDVSALESGLSAWCQQHAVGASKAAWDGKSQTDYAAGSVSLTLKLDNSAATKVTATRNPDGTWSFA